MTFDSIHNYYERLVLDEIAHLPETLLPHDDDDFVSDVACVALNQLPARYVRHNVDMAFYMTADEREQMEQAVQRAVRFAVDYVNKHNDTERPHTYSQ